jgi:hypothetical protein
MAKFKYGNVISKTNTETLSTDKSLSISDSQFQFLNPDSTDRNVTLPDESSSEGMYFSIINTSNTYNLIVKDDSDSEIGVIGPQGSSVFYSNGTVWDVANGYLYPVISSSEPMAPRAGMLWVDTS